MAAAILERLGVLLDVLEESVDLRKRQRRTRIGRAIVNGDSTGGGVGQTGTWEYHIGHKPHGLVLLLRRQQVVAAPIKNPPRLVDIENRGAEAIHEAVTGVGDAVIEEQPSLRGFNW